MSARSPVFLSPIEPFEPFEQLEPFKLFELCVYLVPPAGIGPAANGLGIRCSIH